LKTKAHDREMIDRLVEFVRSELESKADPKKAAEMAAYMKTDAAAFYGVFSSDRKAIQKQLKERFPIEDVQTLGEAVAALWDLGRREERYIAIELAAMRKKLIDPALLPLYEHMIRQGAWWDTVDAVAVNLVGKCLLEHRDEMSKIMDRWIDDPDMWVRRSAILAHNKHKAKADKKRLFAYCLKRAGEKEFFIRKAIGWALRDYAYADPDAVREFVLTNKDKLSPLSFREAAKHLGLK
jgi:3-methyladenine DNA glycosylase AlkD